MFWNKKISLESEMIEFGREVERGIILWGNMFDNYFKNNNVDINKITEGIENDKSLSNLEKINEVNEILKSSNAYRNKLREYSLTCAGFITSNLDRFEKKLESSPKIKSYDKEKEWIKLSRDLSKVYSKKIIAVDNHIDIFDSMFNFFIKCGASLAEGATNEEIDSFQKNFKEKSATFSALIKFVNEEQKKIEPNRSNIAEDLFGKHSDYFKGGSYSKLLNEIKK